MSVVTGIHIILTTGDDIGFEKLDNLFRSWDRTIGPNFSDATAGPKHPQTATYIVGINHFESDRRAALIALFKNPRTFEAPENAILVLQPEEGTTEVHRPEGY
jgi:hypothetical protein